MNMALTNWIVLFLSLSAVVQKSFEEEQRICTSEADVVFMVDSSSSINFRNFNKSIKEFVKKSAAEFGVAPEKSRAAVILFSADAEAKIKFGDAPTLEKFQEKVDELKHQRGRRTRIDKALILANQLFSKLEKDGRKKVAILLTDGKQNPLADLEKAAKPLHAKNVITIAVGIGDALRKYDELKKITKSKDNVVINKDYKELQEKLLNIISIACEESNCGCFSGSSYITVKNYEDKKARAQDDIHFEFKSSKPSGTIMFVQGNYSDHIYVGYDHGDRLVYRVDLGKGERQIMAKGVKLDDNKWHTFRLMRVGRSFTITIDNAHRPQAMGEVPGDFERLDITKSKGYFLGSLNLHNFTGCIRDFRVDEEAIIANAIGGESEYSVTNKNEMKQCTESDQE